ncbi:UNVERIFIED_ORG: hypothetical protein B2H93_04955 [Clostridium botulinum]
MKYTDVSYSHVPEDSECILNAVQLSKLIDEPDTTVRNWADKHQQYLYIKKINNRFVYTQASVDQFKFIKDLCRNKNFTHKQIAEHIKQHGFKYQSYDSGLVNPEDPLGFQALSSALALENNKQLQEFLGAFIKFQKEENNKFIQSIKTEVSLTVQDQLEDSMTTIESQLEQQKEDNKKLNKQLENVRQELELTKNITQSLENTILDSDFLEELKETKRLAEQSKSLTLKMMENSKNLQEKQSLFSKIFNRKK